MKTNDEQPAKRAASSTLKPHPKPIVITENGGLRKIDREKQRQAA